MRAASSSEWPLLRHAISCNLDIFYARVDETGTINDDDSKNVNVECWLEFGPIEYACVMDGEPSQLLHTHDIDLDCGAPTFDEALVRLGNLALKHYGDYEQGANREPIRGGTLVPLSPY